jgi:starvation-inducible DNA-binding protein
MQSASEETILSVTSTDARESAFSAHIEMLEALFAHSIQLRDLYKAARWQTADIRFRRLRQLFDVHYQGQVRLVDVLIDRLRTLNGGGRVFAGDFLDQTRFARLLHGRATVADLLTALFDAHESILNVAIPGGAERQAELSFTRDFAVGRVVLTNEEQILAIREQSTQQRALVRTQPTLD